MAFVESCRSLIRALTLHDKEILKMNDECEFMLEYLLRQLNQHIEDNGNLPIDEPISTEDNAEPMESNASDALLEPADDRLSKKSKRKATMISS